MVREKGGLLKTFPASFLGTGLGCALGMNHQIAAEGVRKPARMPSKSLNALAVPLVISFTLRFLFSLVDMVFLGAEQKIRSS